MILTNLNQGSYLPYFFYNPAFNLSAVYFLTEEKTETVGLEFFLEKHSFTYLRDTIRHIDAYDAEGNLISFNEFLSRMQIVINSQNLFKAGKYLSRVFRPVRYAKHYDNLKIYVNKNYDIKLVDGICIVSKNLAHNTGWNAEVGESAQFTLFYNDGLVKGNCVVSNTIEPDVVIFDGNIKDEIKYLGGFYISFEPLKLKRGLVLDIQSLINLNELFKNEQLAYAFINGTKKFKFDFVNGKLNEWLQDYDKDDFSFVLGSSIANGIDYRRYPGLVRSAWRMFHKSIVKISTRKNGDPDFRIPINFGFRGYLRVDLRNHDKFGNFKAQTKSVCLDKFGNLWINPDLIPDMFKILGGADQDDSVAIIPISKEEAVIYRNPNQFGEYQIVKIEYDGLTVNKFMKKVGDVPIKEIKSENKFDEIESKFKNPYLFYQKTLNNVQIEYNPLWLARTLSKILNNDANIGLAANAEMIMASVRMLDDYGKKLFDELKAKFNWDLEKIIDSTVKDGSDVSEEIKKIYEFYEYCVENEVPVPLCLKNRVPEKYRDKMAYIEDNLHPLDQLHEALRKTTEMIEEEILGKGYGEDRIKGWIDYCQPDIEKVVVKYAISPLREYALELLRDYKNKVRDILAAEFEEDELTNDLIKLEQRRLLDTLNDNLSEEDILHVVATWMIEIYLSDNPTSDGVLWNKFIAPFTIKVLTNTEPVEPATTINNQALETVSKPKVKTIRIWSLTYLDAKDFKNVGKIKVANRKVTGEFNCIYDVYLGDEVNLPDGEYEVIDALPYFRRTNRKLSSHSVVLTIKI